MKSNKMKLFGLMAISLMLNAQAANAQDVIPEAARRSPQSRGSGSERSQEEGKGDEEEGERG